MNWFPFRRSPRVPKGYDSIQLTEFQQWSHHLLLGKTGVGKSQLLRQFLWQWIKAKRPRVVFDPERELIQEFWMPGDSVFNAYDDRTFHWAIEREFKGLGGATSLARCLLSRGDAGAPTQNDIWYGWGTDTLAAFLTIEQERKKLCLERFCEALANPAIIRKTLQGTAYANMLPEKAPEQTAGVEGMLTRLATPLGELPFQKSKKHPAFSVREFLNNPRPNTLWITTVNETREASRPAFSALMSLALRGVMSREEHLYMLFLYDEFQLADHLEPFMEAFTNMRKRKSMMVAGTQTMAQGRLKYGDQWDVISSMPGQTWWFATSGKGLEEAVEEMGEETFIRSEYSESEGIGIGERSKRTYHTRRYTEPVVPKDAVQGLKNLQVWFSQRGFGPEGKSGHMIAIPAEVPLFQRPKVHPALVPRPMPPMKIYQAAPQLQKQEGQKGKLPEPLQASTKEQLEAVLQATREAQARAVKEQRRKAYQEAETKSRNGKPAYKTSAQKQNEKVFGQSGTALEESIKETNEDENPYR